ncbi:MAG TPA: LiaF domain-containing protein [Gemmatimonadaceae bacterium]|nr:LiaF domain-containing protein [Gemmatimonadaceae bacterium]
MTDYPREKQPARTRIPEASYLPAREEPLPEASPGIVSFLSNMERKGKWQFPRRVRALAVLGNIELDLREAEVGLGVSIIEVVSVLGNIDIIVPPEIAVECEGDALIGSFSVHYDKRVGRAVANPERTVRITGNAYLASVNVKVKGPNKSMLARLGRTFDADRR